jgi:hypothetical protein
MLENNRVLYRKRDGWMTIYSVFPLPHGKYQVVCKWGDRESLMHTRNGSVFDNIGAARIRMNDSAWRRQRNSDYIDLETGIYEKPCTIAQLHQYLAPEPDEPETAKNTRPIKAGKIFRVKCLNNLGIELLFDRDGEYNAETTDDEEMLKVCGNNGAEVVFAERFEQVS